MLVGVKRRIQDEDETDVPEELPKKKFKVEEDLNMTIEDEKKEQHDKSTGKNTNGDATFEKEVRPNCLNFNF
jgi:hypothetical protein